MALYQEIAYPLGGGYQDWGYGINSNEPLLALHNILRSGNTFSQVELRSGSVNYAHTKQRFEMRFYHPDWKRENELETKLDINVSIPIASILFTFSEDIAMAVAYGQQAAEYFKDEGIQIKN